MKKLFYALATLTCIAVLLNTTNIRIAQGEITSRTYIEEGDYTNTFLTTNDGETWVAENYTAPIGDKVFIIYDMCDKSTIYDDEIVYIIHLTSFE